MKSFVGNLRVSEILSYNNNNNDIYSTEELSSNTRRPAMRPERIHGR